LECGPAGGLYQSFDELWDTFAVRALGRCRPMPIYGPKPTSVGLQVKFLNYDASVSFLEYGAYRYHTSKNDLHTPLL